MGQGKRGIGICVAGKGNEPDKIVGPATKVTLISPDKLEKYTFCHLEPVQLLPGKDHLGLHAA